MLNYILKLNNIIKPYYISRTIHTNYISSNSFIEKYNSIFKIRSQHNIRLLFIKTQLNTCIICKQHYPFYCLELAHIKPKNICHTKFDKYNIANLSFICCLCHTLYDRGMITIYPCINKQNKDISYCNNSKNKIKSILIHQLNTSNIKVDSDIYNEAKYNILQIHDNTLCIDNVINHKINISNLLLNDLKKHNNTPYFNNLINIHNKKHVLIPYCNNIFNINLYTNINTDFIRETILYHLTRQVELFKYHNNNIFIS